MTSLSFQTGPTHNEQNLRSVSVKNRVGGTNVLHVFTAAKVQPIELRAVASLRWLWLNHNILSTDMLSHGIQLWPIAKQQGYLWLSLIGWSLSTKLKGHIPGTQPEAQTGSSRFTLLSHAWSFFSPPTDDLICCVTLSLFLVFPLLPLMFPLYSSSKLP